MKSAATLGSLILLLHHVRAQDANLTDKYAFCGDCWCIPDDGETCPYDDMPPTEFSDTLIQNLKGMSHENPLALDCDPFYDTGCDTVPALETGDVCGALIKANGDQCPQDYSYTYVQVALSDWYGRQVPFSFVSQVWSGGILPFAVFKRLPLAKMPRRMGSP